MYKIALPCDIIQAHYIEETLALKIPSSIYIKCDKFYYQISVRYQRGNFFWIPKDDLRIENVSKKFGDLNRGFNR